MPHLQTDIPSGDQHESRTVVAALRRDAAGTRLVRAPRPQRRAGEVHLAVELAGVCRTDVDVALGKLPVAAPVTLGHEFAGRVLAADDLAEGTPVAVDPVLPCGACAACSAGTPRRCSHASMLGVDRDGAFAAEITVPRRAVHVPPSPMPARLRAYAEPVAATMGVLDADLPREIALTGNGRITELSRRVLQAAGHRCRPIDPDERDSTTCLLECTGTARGLAQALTAAAPGGRVLLKSRRTQSLTFDPSLAVRKEITLQGVSYGSFPQALQWLCERRIEVEDLFGPTLPLSGWADAFALDEQHKVFLQPDAGETR